MQNSCFPAMPEVSEMSQQSKELEEIRQLIRGSGLEEKVFLESKGSKKSASFKAGASLIPSPRKPTT